MLGRHVVAVVHAKQRAAISYSMHTSWLRAFLEHRFKLRCTHPSILKHSQIADVTLWSALQAVHKLQEYLSEELKLCTDIAACTPAVRLVFDRVVLSDSGTLLLLWRNPDGNVWRLRDCYAKAFPGVRSSQLDGTRVCTCIESTMSMVSRAQSMMF